MERQNVGQYKFFKYNSKVRTVERQNVGMSEQWNVGTLERLNIRTSERQNVGT